MSNEFSNCILLVEENLESMKVNTNKQQTIHISIASDCWLY